MEKQRISRVGQIPIYAGKCFRMFLNDKSWKTFISAAVITIIIATVTGEDTFITFKDTRNGAFALVCACIWIGLFNSIQSVCKEREIIKREHRTGLHISAYVIAHMIYEAVLSLVEAIIVTTIIVIKNVSHLPEEPILLPVALEFFVTFFLIIYSSDILGLAISSIVKTPNTAMTVMPFVLIIQLVMAGMIFRLSGMAKVISNITISKWGFQAICTTSNVNALEGADMAFQTAVAEAADYTHTVEHLLERWGLLVLFIFIYGMISIIALKFVDRDKR